MIIAHWELPAALANAKANKKMISRWMHTAKAFGVDEVVLIDVDGLEPFYNDAEMKLFVVPDLPAALEVAKDKTPVYIEVGGADINNFEFPSNPVFIFGSDYGSLPQADVSINTAVSLHCDIMCGVVLAYWRGQWH